MGEFDQKYSEHVVYSCDNKAEFSAAIIKSIKCDSFQ